MEQTDNVEVAAATEAPVSDRPEWLPEKFKSPEDMALSYSELESKLGQGEDALRSKIVSELEQEAYSSRPATAGDYNIPEAVDPELATDNALFQWWANHAYENGYSQEEFEDGISQYAEALEAMQPDLDAERQLLGDNADARIEAVDLWSKKFFPEEFADVVIGIGQSAKGIEALEFLMSQMQGSSVSPDGQPAGRTSEADLRSMMQDPRYWNPVKRDAGYVKQVEEGFSQLYR
jgi:hypothetical protein